MEISLRNLTMYTSMIPNYLAHRIVCVDSTYWLGYRDLDKASIPCSDKYSLISDLEIGDILFSQSIALITIDHGPG